MSPKHYLIYVLSATMSLVAAAWTLAWRMEPLYGDLTRIGGYAERDYGGNAPMEEFNPLAASWGNYDRRADVLVIGDSVANGRRQQQWQNWLAAYTGWAIHTLDMSTVSLGDLLASRLYQRYPPNIVVWNEIERDLLYEYRSLGTDCKTDTYVRRTRSRPLPIHPTGQTPALVARPTGWIGLNPDFSRIWLSKNFLRVLGLEASNTLAFTLARADLLSSRASTQLLVYRPDLRKRLWKERDLQRVRCRFAALAEQFEANGVTRFVTALAPDKSSAYRPWLIDPTIIPKGRLPELLQHFPVADARLDKSVAAAITAGARDVYLPDDTHWAGTGHRIVAKAILELLIYENLAI